MGFDLDQFASLVDSPLVYCEDPVGFEKSVQSVQDCWTAQVDVVDQQPGTVLETLKQLTQSYEQTVT